MCLYFHYHGFFACGCEIHPGFVAFCNYNCHPSQRQRAPLSRDAYGQVFHSFGEMCPECYRDGWDHVRGRGSERTGIVKDSRHKLPVVSSIVSDGFKRLATRSPPCLRQHTQNRAVLPQKRGSPPDQATRMGCGIYLPKYVVR
ncbi:hypothetical protein QR685DRAFT_572090 [Neurospora intermedia]|uniref:Uncharacterized protein n=1 Tax=Neurospora intermedia TaxID=5142 RepID=A0ABR3DFL9_NEUIN